MKENERGNRKLQKLPKPCPEKAKDGETPKANQADGWTLTKWGCKQSFIPPGKCTIYGRREAIFRGQVEGYHADDGRPFLKFTLETTRHRIIFGLPPRHGDEGLNVGHVKALTPGKGIVEFSTGATYTKPEYRTIGIEELSATERTANLLELQAAGMPYPTRVAPKRGTGKRGRRPSYGERELKNVESSIRYHNGSLEAAARALGKDVRGVRRMHDAFRHRQRNLNPDLRERK